MASERRRRELQRQWPKESAQAIGVIPDDDVEALEAWMAHHVAEARMRKWTRALAWYENYHFLRGNHFPHTTFPPLAAGTGASEFTASEPAFSHEFAALADDFTPKIVDNRMIRPFEKNVALLTKDKPEPSVEAYGDDAFDEFAARVGEKLYDAYWEELGMDHHRRELAQLNMVVATNAMEVYFGPTMDPIAVPVYGEAENELTGEMMEGIGDEQGVDYAEREDLQACVWSGFHLDPDPSATANPKTLTWIMRSSYEDLDLVKLLYDREDEGFLPEKLEEVGQVEGAMDPLYWYERMKDVLDTPQTGHGSQAGAFSSHHTKASAENQTILRVLDVRPTRYHPQGRTLIFADTTLIYRGPARAWSEKFWWRWHNYAFSRWWELPGSWWGMPLLSEIVPLQKRINAIDALIRLNREHIAIGSWLIPRTARVRDQDISGLPGQHIYYFPSVGGAKPEPVDMPPLPGEFFAERGGLEKQIDSISLVEAAPGPEVSPSGLRANDMLEFMDRKALEGRMPTLVCWEKTLELVGRNVLMEFALAPTRPNSHMVRRIQQALRHESALALESFVDGTSLRDNVNLSLNVVSKLLSRPEAKREAAKVYAQFVGASEHLTPHERAVLARVLELDEIDQERSPTYRKIRTIISLVKTGMLTKEKLGGLVIPGFDDAQVALGELTTTILSPAFWDQPTEVQEAIWALASMYQAVLEQQQQSQLVSAVRQQWLMARAEKGGAMPDAGGGDSGSRGAGGERQGGGQRQLRAVSGAGR